VDEADALRVDLMALQGKVGVVDPGGIPSVDRDPAGKRGAGRARKELPKGPTAGIAATTAARGRRRCPSLAW
jgi:hypothetical protein